MPRSIPALLFLASLVAATASAQSTAPKPQAARDSSASANRASAASPSDTGQSAGAQAKTVISGFVLDSMTNQPLAGATVLLSGTSRSVTTDAGGRFRFELDSAANGTYTIGFFHPKLDSLGVTPPPRQIQVHSEGENFVELAVPSMRTISYALCPDTSLTDGRGLVAGTVRDAATDSPLDSVRVVLMWTGMSVGNTSVTKVPRAVSVLTDERGSYHACGVPIGTRVTAQARTKTQRSGWIEVDIPEGGIGRRDFLIGTRAPAAVAARQGADTGGKGVQPLGSAILTGNVTATNGQPLEGAQILLLGTQLAGRTDHNGNFRLGGLPGGTQSIEVRQIGYAPRRFAVDLSPNKESKLTAVLEERAVVLEAVEVAAKKGSGIPGFDRRKKSGFGTYITRDDIEKRGAINTSDLFRTIPGVQVMWNGSGYTVQMSRASAGYCPVQYYIDGTPFLSTGGDDMDQIVQPQDIQAIEVYKGPTETPAEFQGGGSASCGTIVIWTRRGESRK
ncbi:MAG TPA: carboxypeptidase regulatory-like domain-containing protein [Gemmatimonadaceae bacterium]|nr:carboxypeptidase regulatory-like domain-containing protein [Gemmatimonadaceae bacterium]